MAEEKLQGWKEPKGYSFDGFMRDLKSNCRDPKALICICRVKASFVFPRVMTDHTAALSILSDCGVRAGGWSSKIKYSFTKKLPDGKCSIRLEFGSAEDAQTFRAEYRALQLSECEPRGNILIFYDVEPSFNANALPGLLLEHGIHAVGAQRICLKSGTDLGRVGVMLHAREISMLNRSVVSTLRQNFAFHESLGILEQQSFCTNCGSRKHLASACKNPTKCALCAETSHRRDSCPLKDHPCLSDPKSKADKSKFHCMYCGAYGHAAFWCPERRAQVRDFKFVEDRQPVQHNDPQAVEEKAGASESASSSSRASNSYSAVMKNGASILSHVCTTVQATAARTEALENKFDEMKNSLDVLTDRMTERFNGLEYQVHKVSKKYCGLRAVAMEMKRKNDLLEKQVDALIRRVFPSSSEPPDAAVGSLPPSMPEISRPTSVAQSNPDEQAPLTVPTDAPQVSTHLSPGPSSKSGENRRRRVGTPSSSSAASSASPSAVPRSPTVSHEVSQRSVLRSGPPTSPAVVHIVKKYKQTSAVSPAPSAAATAMAAAASAPLPVPSSLPVPVVYTHPQTRASRHQSSRHRKSSFPPDDIRSLHITNPASLSAVQEEELEEMEAAHERSEEMDGDEEFSSDTGMEDTTCERNSERKWQN
jgi:hypothetical protein